MGLVACGPVKGNPPETDAPVDTSPGFALSLRTTNVVAPLDGKATFEITVTRTNGFTGEIALAAATPPNGLEVTAVNIPGDVDTAEVELGALAPLAIGDTVDFDVEGTAAGVDSKTVAVEDAEITGKPGSLDVSFGVGTGFATIHFGNDDGGSFNALDVLGGNILATGVGSGGLGAQRFSTMRFLATGAIDTSFNGGSLVNTTFRGGSNEDTRSAAIGHQIDGRAILIGSNQSAPSGTTPDVVLARFQNNGTLSGFEFGSGSVAGKAIIDLGGGTELVGNTQFELGGHGAVLPDGRIVAVGSSTGHRMIMLAGIEGQLDTGFNGTGFLKDVLGNASLARKVAIDSDGKIIVAGTTTSASGDDLTLHRYTTTGPDTSFGAVGRTIINTPNVNEAVLGVAIGSQNKMLLASVLGANFQIRKFDANGMIDMSFGTAGLVETPQNGIVGRAFLILQDQKLVIVGQLGLEAVVMRFLADGSLDPRFGTGGVVTLPWGTNPIVNTAIVYDGQKIVIAGGNEAGVPGPGTDGLIARVWM